MSTPLFTPHSLLLLPSLLLNLSSGRRLCALSGALQPPPHAVPSARLEGRVALDSRIVRQKNVVSLADDPVCCSDEAARPRRAIADGDDAERGALMMLSHH